MQLKGATVNFLGDSITFGYYMEGAGKAEAKGENYPGQLYNLLADYNKR